MLEAGLHDEGCMTSTAVVAVSQPLCLYKCAGTLVQNCKFASGAPRTHNSGLLCNVQSSIRLAAKLHDPVVQAEHLITGTLTL